MSYSEKMSSINLLQTKGLEGLAVSSRFSKSAIKKKNKTKQNKKTTKKITEKETAVLVPIATPCLCMKCLSLNLKGFSSRTRRKSSRKSFVEIGIKLRVHTHSDLRSDGK